MSDLLKSIYGNIQDIYPEQNNLKDIYGGLNPFQGQKQKFEKDIPYYEQEIEKQKNLADMIGNDYKVEVGQRKFNIFDLFEILKYPFTNSLYKISKYIGSESEGGKSLTKNEITDIIKNGFIGGLLLKTKIDGKDILNLWEQQRKKTDKNFKINPVLKFIGGLAMDILLDPTTYLTFGAKQGAKGVQAGKEALEEASQKSSKFITELARGWSEKNLNKLKDRLIKVLNVNGWDDVGKVVKSKTWKQMISVVDELQQLPPKTIQGTLANFNDLEKIVANKLGLSNFNEVIRKIKKEVFVDSSDYGLKFLGKQLFKGSQADFYSKMVGGEATKLGRFVENLPIKIAESKLARLIKKAFSKPSEYGTFTEVGDLQRIFETNANYQVEAIKKVVDDVFSNIDELNKAGKLNHILDEIDNLRKTGKLSANNLFDKKTNIATHEKILTYLRYLSEHSKDENDFLAKLPTELTPIYTKWKEMMDGLFDELSSRNLVKHKGNFLYFPRMYVNKQTGEIGILEKSPTSRFFKERVFESVEDAVANGFKPLSTLESVAIYINKTAKSINTYDFIKHMLEKYGVKAGGEKISHGIEQIKRVTIPHFQNYYAPRDITTALNNIRTMVGNDEIPKIIENIYNKWTNVWKTTVTTVNPGFHIRNALSNIWLLFAKDGVRPKMIGDNLLKANKIFQYGHSGKDDIIKIVVDGKVVKKKLSELYELVRRTGVHTGKFARSEITDSAMKNLLKKSNIFSRAGSSIGEYVENVGRIAGFLDDIAQGYKPKNAALRTMKFFVDYGNLTQFERKLKKYIPFYSWLKNNLVNQIELLLNRPGFYTAISSKPLKNIDRTSEEDKQYMPDWMIDNMYVNIFKNTFLNPNLPFQDVSRMFTTHQPIGNLASKLMNALNPVIKTPFETLLNRSLFDLKPIEKYQGQRKEVTGAMHLLLMALPKQVRDSIGVYTNKSGRYEIPVKYWYSLRALLPVIQWDYSLTDLIKPSAYEWQNVKAPSSAISQIGGVKFYKYNPKYYKLQGLKTQLQQLREANRNYMDEQMQKLMGLK